LEKRAKTINKFQKWDEIRKEREDELVRQNLEKKA
jgi:hypothetical protein